MDWTCSSPQHTTDKTANAGKEFEMDSLVQQLRKLGLSHIGSPDEANDNMTDTQSYKTTMQLDIRHVKNKHEPDISPTKDGGQIVLSVAKPTEKERYDSNNVQRIFGDRIKLRDGVEQIPAQVIDQRQIKNARERKRGQDDSYPKKKYEVECVANEDGDASYINGRRKHNFPSQEGNAIKVTLSLECMDCKENNDQGIFGDRVKLRDGVEKFPEQVIDQRKKKIKIHEKQETPILIKVPRHGDLTIRSYIKEFQEEVLKGANAVECSTCGKRTTQRRKSSIPGSLIVDINRHSISNGKSCVKDCQAVFIDRFLSVDGVDIFRVCEVQCRTGTEIGCGFHITATIDEEWQLVRTGDNFVQQKPLRHLDSSDVQEHCFRISYQRISQSDVDKYLQLSMKETLAKCGEIELNRVDFKTLNDYGKLNDKVVNAYMTLLSKGRSGIAVMDVFDFVALATVGRISRWIDNDLFKHDIILIPANLDFHWCLVEVNLKEKQIRVYNSGSSDIRCGEIIRKFILEKLTEIKYIEVVFIQEMPRQKNDYDCGAFMLKAAECRAKKQKIRFDQSDMLCFRRQMKLNLLSGQIAP